MEQNAEKPTKTGLALFLGFADVKSLSDYGGGRQTLQPFAHLIKKAVSWIEAKHEEKLYGAPCTGSIFWLKNHGWSDNRQLHVDGQVRVEPSPERPAIEAEVNSLGSAICDG